MSGTVIAVNGSPRKGWNTAMLLESALAGAGEAGAETEMVHLYDLDFKGCTSCFACKRKNGGTHGKCAMRDGLSPVLERIAGADALLLGSPIYLGAATGEMRSFVERLVFPYITYTEPPKSLFPRKMGVGLLYTMNITREQVGTMMPVLDQNVSFAERFMIMTFGHAESLCCYDTLQFDDYGKFEASRFDPVAKAQRRKDAFPADRENARALGRRLAEMAGTRAY